LQESDHLAPNNLIEEILPDQAAVVANRTAQFSPAIGANALVVVNLTRGGVRRGSREGITTLRAANQSLHNTGRNGAPTRSYFVLLEKLLGSGEALFGYQSWHGNLDPLFARAFVTDCHARRSHTTAALRTDNACPCRGASLAEAGGATIGGIPQHSPDYGAFPAGTCLTSGNTFSIKSARDLADAEPLHRIHLVYAPNDARLAFIHDISSGRLVGLADIPVTIRSATHHADLARVCAVSFTMARAFQDLRPLIFSDHALELHQKLIFRAVALR
jgi:hypothetical protein